jgi:hypothetical protein
MGIALYFALLKHKRQDVDKTRDKQTKAPESAVFQSTDFTIYVGSLPISGGFGLPSTGLAHIKACPVEASSRQGWTPDRVEPVALNRVTPASSQLEWLADLPKQTTQTLLVLIAQL